MTDEGSPFGHIHKAIDSLNKPSDHLTQAENLGWVYDPRNLSEEINKKYKIANEMLSTLAVISKEERSSIAAEIVLSKAYGDLFGLEYVIEYMRTSLSIKGKGHDDTVKIVAGSTPKISVPTTMQKVKRVLTGRNGEERKETTEMYEVNGGQE